MRRNEEVEKRSEVREQIIGDILWSYDSNGKHHFNEGAIIDISNSGASICTHTPLKAGTTIRLFGERLWQDYKRCTVRWTEEMAPNVYRSGLISE